MQCTEMEYRRRICLAMNFISQNLDRNISLEEIAQVACFSMFHFHRIFRAIVGETVAEFTRRLRLEWAANQLLVHHNKDITTIAIATGFSSSQNFAKAFRQYFAMSPRGYRKSKIGNKISKQGNAFSLQTRYNVDILPSNFTNHERLRLMTMNAEVKELPEYNVAYVRKIGRYGKETCEQAFGELMHWAGPHGYLTSGIMLGVYWDNPEVTAPEKCRTDACITVPPNTKTEAPVASQKIHGGPYAVCHFEIKDDSFQQAWQEAFTWLIQRGYACDDSPCYERYYNNAQDHPEHKWIFDICIPLKRQ